MIFETCLQLTLSADSILMTFVGCVNGSIRVMGGSSSMEGRVEICQDGDWGTVCDDGWTTVDANIACRQLGFSNSGENDMILVVIVHSSLLLALTRLPHCLQATGQGIGNG